MIQLYKVLEIHYPEFYLHFYLVDKYWDSFLIRYYREELIQQWMISGYKDILLKIEQEIIGKLQNDILFFSPK